ncbi:MAG: hypothetical protein R2726_06005 [Acidimicrobiales bacterium]
MWTAYAVLEVVFAVVKIWAVITWLRLPAWAWTESDHSRLLWLGLLLLAFLLPLVGFVLALWFLFSTSVDVRRIARLGARPGFPGGV